MLQSKTRVYRELASQGYLQSATEIFGAGTRFPVICHGWALTHKGRIAYCDTFRDSDDEEDTL